MNILLINPICRLPCLLPLGLGYIASVLREEGYNVKILDINGFGYSDKEVEEIIRTSDFDVVGIGGLTSTYKYVKWLASVIKRHKSHIPIIAGNMVSTASPELLLRNSSVDIAVIDEGELTIKELILAIKNKRGFAEIKGIVYKDGEKIVKNPQQKRILDLDSLPFPAWDMFPMETYLNNSTLTPGMFGLRSINISSERGCPYECTFCSHPFGRHIYARSANSIINEIKQLKKKYQVQFISFTDDLFLVNRERALEFCKMMISENLNIKWSATGRVNLVNDDLLKILHKAGCVELGYGIESGSQTLLDKMKKRVTVKQAEEAIRMTKKAKIGVAASFIFGMPGETEETIQETLNFIKRVRLPAYRFFYANPYPNTELYEIAKRMDRIPKDEDKYLEKLGEMRTTFLVNLTDFSDEELVRLKNLTELTVRKNLSLRLKIEEFIGEWHRRYVVIRLNIREKGFITAVKIILFRIMAKIHE